MLRVLTWHIPDSPVGEGSQGPRYYILADSEPLRLQIYAEIAPQGDSLKVDILNDGETIMSDYYAVLPEGMNSDDAAEDFVNPCVIQAGSWVYLDVIEMSNAKNVSVHLVLESLEEEISRKL